MTPSEWRKSTEALVAKLEGLYDRYYLGTNPYPGDQAREFIEEWPRIDAALRWALDHPLVDYMKVGD